VQALKVDGKVTTNSKEKANFFNFDFKLAFTNEPDEIPDKGPSPHPTMESIDTTTAGIVSLLNS